MYIFSFLLLMFYIIRYVAVALVREKGHEREDDNAKIDLSSRNRVAK